MQLGCDPTAPPANPNTCNASQIAYLNDFRTRMISALQPVMARSRSGAFLPECSIHVIEDDDGAWSQFLVESQTQRDTMRSWYLQAPSLKAYVVDGVWGSNPTCKLYTSAAASQASESIWSVPVHG
jgi:hypothetical protein